VKIAQIVQERRNRKASQNLGNGRQQSYVYGKDNHIISESVQETPDTIIEDYLDTTLMSCKVCSLSMLFLREDHSSHHLGKTEKVLMEKKSFGT
jgi:hypothetical protein